MSTQEATGVLVERRRWVRWATIEQPVLYGCAAVSYVGIGVFVNALVLSWFVAFTWLLLWVWLLPAAIRRALR